MFKDKLKLIIQRSLIYGHIRTTSIISNFVYAHSPIMTVILIIVTTMLTNVWNTDQRYTIRNTLATVFHIKRKNNQYQENKI